MAISKAQKVAFNDETKGIKKEIDDIKKHISELSSKKKKMTNITGYLNFEISLYLIKSVSLHIKMNELSVQMMGIKNSKFLESARAEFYKSLQTLEEIVGAEIDRGLTENDDFLVKIDRINPKQVLELSKGLLNMFFNLKNSFGEGTKWKWAFVELQGRIAVIIKNFAPFSEIGRIRDPREEFFYDRQEMMQLSKDNLTEAAKQFRTKYELSGKARDDLKKSIDFLSALRKIHVLFKEDEDANKLKNTIDAAKQALEAEDKSKDEKKKKK